MEVIQAENLTHYYSQLETKGNEKLISCYDLTLFMPLTIYSIPEM